MSEIILSTIAVFFLLALGIFARIQQRTVTNSLLLTVAFLLAGMEASDRLSLRLDDHIEIFRTISLYCEAFLPVACMLLSLSYGRNRPFEVLSKIKLGIAGSVALFPLGMLLIMGNDIAYSPDFHNERVLFLGNEGYWYYIGVMTALIFSLTNVEVTLSSTYGMARNRMKFEAIGIMSLFAVLVFYYSQGLLYRTINLNLIPIRSTIFIVASILIVYSQVFRGGETRILISRHIVYRSITLLVVGAYLIGLGFIGEGMRYFGDAFGRNIAIVLSFGGGILLLVVLLSENVRRTTKVYISKHFYANKHDYRAEWIKFTNLLTSCSALGDVQEAVLSVYRDTFGVGGATLYLPGMDQKRYSRTLQHYMKDSPEELIVSKELGSYFLKRERVLDLTDEEHPLSGKEKAAMAQGGTWLIVPLISNNRIEGLVALSGRVMQERLIYDDYDLMKVLARQAAQSIRNYRLSEEVMEMRAMAAVAKISTFVIHDLKNLTTGLSLCVDNAEEYIGNPDFQKDAITTMRNTLFKMKDLMQRLRAIPEKTALESQVKDIDRLSREVVREFEKLRPKRVVYKGEPAFSRVDRAEIKKVIVNIVQNALEASSEKGTVLVDTGKANGRVCIRVSDTGSGMTEDFIKNDLFKPFRTTKETGLGIGLYQCRQIVEAHEGRIEVKSEFGKGSVFTICLPVSEAVE